MNIKKIFGRTAVAASLAVMAAVPQAASAGSTGGTDCTVLTGTSLSGAPEYETEFFCGTDFSGTFRSESTMRDLSGSDRHAARQEQVRTGWNAQDARDTRNEWNTWNVWNAWDVWDKCDGEAGWESDSGSYPSYPWIDTGEDGGGTDSGFGTVSSYASEVADIVNQERTSQGLSPLSYDSQLAELAQKKAEDMAENGYFSHQSPTYGSAFDMMNEAGISYRSAGENIARGQRTPEAVMDSWMNSSGHRANILSSSYSSVGVGYAEDENGTAYWVQMFLG